MKRFLDDDQDRPIYGEQVIPKHILMQRDVPAYGIRAANKVLQ
ncbi:predicted protein [Sclerotinia sclerotiorum 1980 UF-70]|uniref:Uncharacterized protein n=1 Tax=Sclerotinia sclerotiorum (strain ATCC 18683 / 1980 / Ss-1) TaxID=665079 RepID=A7EGJ7_SCLS1|nr:predicted protein [Sclerotinia sclerotiorum 1980 UF-70]EDO01963.1 predicted protein [Sclerotinia sclerotiorum 1980 UF-70]